MTKKTNLWVAAVAIMIILIGGLAEQSNAAINIALNKPASTNKSIWSDFWPSKAVDGDIETIWGAGHHGNPADPTWLKVDLEDVFSVKQIVLKVRTWQTQYAGYYVDYILYSSEDGQIWEEIVQGRLIDFDDPIDTIELNDKSMRYLRYDVVGGTHWAHLHEMEIYVEPTNLEIVGPGEVAENSQVQYKAIAVYDNNSTQDVTASAEWSVEPNDIASISAGLLTTEMVDLPTDITITAQYGEDPNTESAEKDVSIFAICPSGSALDFDGTDDYVDLGDLDVIVDSQPFTITAWVCPNFIGSSNRGILTKAAGVNSYQTQVLMRINFEGKLEGIFSDGSTTGNYIRSNKIIPLNSWSFLTFNWNGTTNSDSMKLYINGVLDKTRQSTSSSIFNIDYPAFIGAYSNSGSLLNPFDGKIDEVAIYNRALSAEEIQMLMHIRPDTDDPNLVAYWDFDEGSGQVAYDSAGGNDGQLGSTDGIDDNDPNWVDSDAPVGICTMEELFGRNINQAINLKLDMLDILEEALGKETAGQYILEQFLNDGDSNVWKKRDILESKRMVRSAVQNEEKAEINVDQSIDKLDDALDTLGIE